MGAMALPAKAIAPMGRSYRPNIPATGSKPRGA